MAFISIRTIPPEALSYSALHELSRRHEIDLTARLLTRYLASSRPGDFIRLEPFPLKPHRILLSMDSVAVTKST